MNAPLHDNPPRQLVETLIGLCVEQGDDACHEALDAYLDQFSNVELAARLHDYEGFWARKKQRIPRGKPRFSSWGFLTGRGFGKTWAISAYIVDQVLAGHAKAIGLMAQSIDMTLKVMVHGPAGLIQASPFWCKPKVVSREGEPPHLLWPNGAKAHFYTPLRPEEPRGYEADLFWVSEWVAWPKKHRAEAMKNIDYALRAGFAVLVWDTTPKPKHPIIRDYLQRNELDPVTDVVIRGHSKENIENLNRQRLERLISRVGDTRAGREELAGEFFDEDEGALWEQSWIDSERHPMPVTYARRGLAIDPAISERAGTDETGFVEACMTQTFFPGSPTPKNRAFVIADDSGTYRWEAWGAKAVKRYIANALDIIVIERNRGGDACVANIRLAVAELNRKNEKRFEEHGGGVRPVTWKVKVVPNKQRTKHVKGTVFVKEVNSTRGKARRAEPVATFYKLGGVSHVEGADLHELESQMTTWEPANEESPDRIDALVFIIWELCPELNELEVDLTVGAADIGKLHAEMKAASTQLRTGAVNKIAELLGKNEWSGGI